MTEPIRILIVEDLATNLELVESELRRGGLSYSARHAASGVEFHAAIDAELPDLVLADFNLPDIDGMDVVHEVAARSDLIPVIIVTGSLDEETAANCIKAGATDYILKDRLSRLVPAVRAAMELRRLRQEELRAQGEILRARDFYITLFDEFPNPVWRCKADGNADYFNRAWCDYTGRTVAQESGDGWIEGVHRDDVARVAAAFLAAFDERQLYFTEYRLRGASGSYHWFASYGRPIYGLEGEFAGLIGSAYDVQAAHELQQRIESQWRFLESVLDHIDQLIYVFDANDVIRFANQTTVEAPGLRLEELLGHSIDEFAMVTPEYRTTYDRAKSTREQLHFGPSAIPTRSGEKRVYEGWFIPFVGPDSEEGVIASFSDVTDRVEAEGTRRLLMTAIEHSAEAVVITDADGNIEYVNPSFEATSGYSSQEALGQTPRLLESGLQDRALYTELWSTITSGQAWRGNLINRRKDGSTYHEEVSISPVPDASGKIAHFVAVKRNLSRELELELQLSQARRLDAIGRLAGGVAHDFNNLLGVIGGYAELLAQSLGENHPGQARIGQMRKATQRAASLTHQLLAFGRRQVLQPHVVDLNELLRESHELLRQLLRESIDFELIPSVEPATALVDRSQMEQVFFNLVVNAREAMPAGGTLRIETSRVDGDTEPQSPDGATGSGQWVCVSVSDSGAGIPAEQLMHIFEPFYTTHADTGGTGLGLSTVYGIVRQSGGNIQVTSVVGRGTTFKVYLPAVDAPATEVAAREPALPAKRESRPFTILVAEDVDLLREMIREGLEASGMRVLDARNGQEALELSRRETGPIDLLLSDVVMPRMSGRELGEAMQREREGLVVLFMSGYTSDVIAATGVLEEGMNLLQKPFTIDTLLDRIHALLGGAP